MAQYFFFYLFSGLMLASAFTVIAARNPVHSVLFLILAFVNASALFMMTGAEFLAMLLIVVYVGAVAVLFLFVVMMLDVDFAALRRGFAKSLPVGALVGLVVAIELVFMLTGWKSSSTGLIASASPTPEGLTNTQAMGRILYTDYFIFFQAAGFVLLTAMVGAIVLTLQHRPDVKRQNIAEQNARDPRNAVEIKKVSSRAGV